MSQTICMHMIDVFACALKKKQALASLHSPCHLLVPTILSYLYALCYPTHPSAKRKNALLFQPFPSFSKDCSIVPSPSSPPHNPATPLQPPESIKPLIRIPNKRQTHLRTDILTLCSRLRPQRRTHIRLRNLINREVLRIHIGGEFRFKGCADATETVPLNAAEEGVLFDFVGAADAAEAVFGVVDEAGGVVSK